MLKKLLLLGFIAAVAILFMLFDLHDYLSLTYIKQQQAAFASYYAQNALLTISIFAGVYILVTALSFPGAAVMTLAAGGLFGLTTGTVIVSFASTIGCTLAFLIARFLMRDWVQSKYQKMIATIDSGIKKDGIFYLLTLRMIPVFPFFIVNLLMGLTAIKIWKYFLISQIGMLPGTLVYVYAGLQLGKIDSLDGILSSQLLLSFTLLGLFPWLAKWCVSYVKARRVMWCFKKPQKFDYNLVVIGAGAAGLVSAYIASAVKAKVALIEKHKMGGDCLNTGCVPSKALIRSAKILSYIKRAKDWGFEKAEVDFDFSKVMQRVHDTIKKIAPHDSIERYTKLGVECISGSATITSPYTVQVGDRELTTKNIIVATGARPFIPDITGIEKVDYYTSDTIWNLTEDPKKLLVLGGGAIGCELTQCFARLGVETTLVTRSSQLLTREDPDVIELVAEKFKQENVKLLLDHEAREFILEDEDKYLVCEYQGKKVKVAFDTVLIALGRQANTQGFGLEELGVELTSKGTIAANQYLATNCPNIYVCGDVIAPYQFTHTAAHEAWYASVNALFSPLKKFKVDYRVIPCATFTDPEVARVGLNEKEAMAANIAYEVTSYGIDDLDRAIADSEDIGFVKVLTVPGKDKILGVTIVGTHAGDLIAEFILAMKHGIGLNKILGTIHIYPTLAEANKYAAGAWKKNHVSPSILNLLKKIHTWRRG